MPKIQRFVQNQKENPIKQLMTGSSFKYTFAGVFLFLLSLLLIWFLFLQTKTAAGEGVATTQKLPPTAPIVFELPKAPTKEEVSNYIAIQSKEQGLNPEMMLCIAFHESGYDYLIKNKHSTASGVFQFLKGTWIGTRTQMGMEPSSPFNAKDNIDTAIWKVKHGGIHAWDLDSECF